MDKAAYERMMEIFLEASSLSGAELEHCLAKACGSDHELSERIRRMVNDERLQGYQTTVAGDVETKAQTGNGQLNEAVLNDRFVGDYEVLSELGRGAMGVVYKAKQTSLGRVVALKRIISGQLAGEADITRFKLEAEAAATLDHAGIVPIYEIGEHQGQPFFSMGFVNGGSLASRLKDGPLEPKEAARLARELSDSIAYAHSQGIIHRDLKPANILIDKAGRTRVTDFGLAKRLDGTSQLTATGQILGTPSYMPPEQASGQVDQAKESADIYSLGAVLYHMLCGRPPFQAASAIDTLIQVTESYPTPPIQLNRQIPKDLDTICLKCLEKKTTQRYESARELHCDLVRYLESKPINARRKGVLIVGSRWVKRRPALALAISLSLAFLFAVVGLSIGMAVQQSRASAKLRAEKTKTDEALTTAKEERRRAEENEATATREANNARRQAEIAESVNEFLNVDLLSAVSPTVEAGHGRDVRMIEVLQAADSRINKESGEGGRFANKPLVEAAIRATLGLTLRKLGEYRIAQPHLERALELHRIHAGATSRQALVSARELATLYCLIGEFRKGETLLRESLLVSRKEFGDNELTVSLCGRMGRLLLDELRMEDAAPFIEEHILGLQRLRGANNLNTLLARLNYPTILISRGQLEEALAELENLKTEAIDRFGEEDFVVVKLYDQLGSVQRRLNRYDEAEHSRRKALAGYREAYGDEHPYTLSILSNLGVSIHMAGRHEEATPFLREAMEGRTKALEKSNSDVLFSKCYLAFNMAALDEPEKALELVNEAIDDARELLPEDDWNIGDCLAMKGRILQLQTEYEQADLVLEEAYQQLTNALGPYHGYTYNALMNAINLFDEWSQQDGHPDLTSRHDIWHERLKDFYRNREEMARRRSADATGQ